MMEGEMTGVLAQRKIQIPQTIHGKNDKKFGSTLISFLLQRKFGSSQSSSMVKFVFSSTKKKNIPALGIRKQTMEGGHM